MAQTAMTVAVAGDPVTSADQNAKKDNIEELDTRVIALEVSSSIGVLTSTDDYTILDSDGYGYFYANTANKKIIYTLPTSADNDERELYFKAIANGGQVEIDGEGAETIDGLSSYILYGQNDYLKIKSDGSNWIVVDKKVTIETGWINTSDWSNRHLGTMDITYSGASGTFTVGEIITESTSLNTWRIVSDSGTVFTCRAISGTGHATTARTLTGTTSTETATVNGSTKNVDSNLLHEWGVDQRKIKSLLYVSTDGTEANSFCIPWADSGGGGYGQTYYQIDTDNIKLQTGSGGILYVNDSGSVINITTSDWYYNIVMELT